MFSVSSNPQNCLFQSISSKKHNQMRKLSDNFSPGEYSVLCGRGSKCTKSPGNLNLKRLVLNYLKAYSEATNKVEKTSIVSVIIRSVKERAPDGAFIKYEGGAWWEVEDAFAREKIGCLFRDCLFTQYRSSTKAKLARKKATTRDPASTTSVVHQYQIVRGNFHNQLLPTCSGDSICSPPLVGSMNEAYMSLAPNPLVIPPSSQQIEFLGETNLAQNTNCDPDLFTNCSVNRASNPFENEQQFQPYPRAFLFPQYEANMRPDSCSTPAKVSCFSESFTSRTHRQDCLHDCLPETNNMITAQYALQATMGNNFTPGSHCSLLRQACSVVDECPVYSAASMDNSDFPDDLSDIFDS